MSRCAMAGLAVLIAGAGCRRESPAPTTAPTTTQALPTTKGKPMRIASVMLATDEILLDLVGLDRLVAVTVYADQEGYSNVVGRIPKHVARVRGEIEPILSVKPDLVCVSTLCRAGFLKLLERSGLRYVRNNHYHTFAEIRVGILRLGDAVGEPERAKQMVEHMDARLSAVGKKLAGITSRPRVLHWSGGWTSGANTTVHDLIEAAGGRNAAAEIGLRNPCEISTEQVLRLDPDYVLVSVGPDEMSFGAVEKHPVLSKLRAVEHRCVIRMPGRYLLTVSHYMPEGVEYLARQLHPERFKRLSDEGARGK